MTYQQSGLFILLGLLFVMLVWGRIRYDLAAFAALTLAVLSGLVDEEAAFAGFGHPATVIVAMVLIVSRGLANSGAVDLIARSVIRGSASLSAHISLISVIGAALSALMNNVAALALLMPVDMEAAVRAKRSPSLTLMPLSFATILGGMVTLIGTPPNIVVATFRGEALGDPFTMFDFAAVGIVVAVVGVVFVSLVGWRLLPVERSRHNTRQELQDLTGYVAEAQVTEDATVVGNTLDQLYPLAEEYDVAVLGLIRAGRRMSGFARGRIVRTGDFVVIQGGVEFMDKFIGAAGLEYASAQKNAGVLADNQVLLEVVVPEGARIQGRSAMSFRLAARHNSMLLGVSRQGRQFRERIRKLKIRAGDILLLSGSEDELPDVAGWLGCLPLAERGLVVIQRKKAWLAIGLFAAAIAAATTGVVYLPVALAAAALVYVIAGLVPLSQLYESIEWPVIVLLGSLIPIGIALESSGAAELIAKTIIEWTDGLPVVFILIIIMVVTMTLSDMLNNVATALIAAPIAVELAVRLEVSPDPFLMAVAVAASCAFLTPIGHKNNTIILGPGGYRFGDYWRMGLPLEVLVVAVGVPMILWVWPL
ncbi:MAG TPA: SLC13 family permease [Gammaproteobacteria bacterium]|jgi:di/tricarboxylate transporter|nr:SLC13 family permease [Gammaproteobacteria bacterium]RTZ65649.1 MAG: SLC13 family permease [Gammaproteobacteria bacterium]HAD37464.1 SLC13 family permease [Gammaproteobacteria bacterium]HHZ72123.1 SLC13 family permease [Gammaproteobacteria bacterium]HIA41566.1 SLC13 family permease [Gammaproteobacteria bacterium]